jgi:hypothetical protein
LLAILSDLGIFFHKMKATLHRAASQLCMIDTSEKKVKINVAYNEAIYDRYA